MDFDLCQSPVDLCLLRVITPKIIRAHPIARIKKFAGIIMAHIEFTLLA